MNSIFTGSPIEGHIIALFMRAQLTTASFLVSTPIFRALLFIALTWAVLHGFLQIGMNHQQARQTLVTIVYRTGLVFLALTLLGRTNTGVVFSSVDGPWNSYAGVQSDVRYASTLNGTPQSLWAYGMVYEALNGVAKASADAAAQAFSDETLSRDPLFLIGQLRRMASLTLSPGLQREYVELIRDCGAPSSGKVIGDAQTSIREMLDLTRPECQEAWDQFVTDASAEGTELLAQYPEYIVRRMVNQLQAHYQTIGVSIDQEGLGNIAVAFATYRASIDLLTLSQSGRTRHAQATAGQKGDAGGTSVTTTPDVGDDFLRQYAVINSLGAYVPDENDIAAKGWHALSTQFQNVAPYIPAARGYIQGVLAILFVFALYTLGFGSWKYMRMWFIAEATICLYQPIALLGFKISDYFFLEDQMARTISVTSTDALVIGGARILNEQMARIQTVYVAFELGAFFIFCIGAIRIFQPLSHLSMNMGSLVTGMMGMPGSPGTMGMPIPGVTAPAPSSAVLIPAPTGAGPAALNSPGGGTPPLAALGTGTQSPSNSPPNTWDGPT